MSAFKLRRMEMAAETHISAFSQAAGCPVGKPSNFATVYRVRVENRIQKCGKMSQPSSTFEISIDS
jgi:hypothetical protein